MEFYYYLHYVLLFWQWLGAFSGKSFSDRWRLTVMVNSEENWERFLGKCHAVMSFSARRQVMWQGKVVCSSHVTPLSTPKNSYKFTFDHWICRTMCSLGHCFLILWSPVWVTGTLAIQLQFLRFDKNNDAMLILSAQYACSIWGHTKWIFRAGLLFESLLVTDNRLIYMSLLYIPNQLFCS